ncbi:MAG: leucine-rich repeat domain-containing protein, partial [Treponema sp.]
MFAFSCKQANNAGEQKPDAPIESNEIIITVKGDDGVIVSKLNTIKVKKSLNLTWKDIKQKAIEKITTKENKEIKEWRLKDAKGEVLKDTDTFKKDETVWCVSKNKEKPPTNPITITIEADEGYTFKEATKPCTIEVQKGSAWSSIKEKAEDKIELKDGYEKTGWKLGGKDGGYLEDSAVFNENALIFTTSKKKGEPDKPKVTITVKGDEGVEVGSPNNFSADSGSKWASIKTQAEEKAKAKAHFELLEWHLSESTGTLITDETEFKENATVFAVSKEKPKAKYKVEHHQQNLLNEEYTKKETEEKEGFAGEETEAEAKPYPGFTAHTFKQKEIKANGKTLVRILYKRNIVSLIIDLKGGETTTELQDGTGGKKLLTGKFEGEVSIKTPTKQGVQFEGWEPELPTNFPANDETVYTAKWGAKTAYRVTIEGDERVKVAEPQYMDVPIGSNKKIEDIKAEIIAKASLASGWLSEDYTFYDWRIGGEKGEEMQDATQITEDITVYARTNYKRFKLWGTTLEGYEGGKPRGRIFIPKTVKIIENEVFKECDGLKAVDLSGCSELIEIAGSAFSGCSSLESIDLSPCVKLTKIGKNAFKGCSKLKSVNLASCSELTEIGGDSWDNGAFNGCTSLESIDLSPCVKLTKIGK